MPVQSTVQLYICQLAPLNGSILVAVDSEPVPVTAETNQGLGHKLGLLQQSWGKPDRVFEKILTQDFGSGTQTFSIPNQGEKTGSRLSQIIW